VKLLQLPGFLVCQLASPTASAVGYPDITVFEVVKEKVAAI
jgi:hypothetical protein